MITKEQEAECSKSKLYFKDPGNGNLLTGTEPRVAGPSADSDKFIYPQIEVSTGDVVKLSYTLWTDEEKQIYKDYRSRGKSNPRPKKEKTNDSVCSSDDSDCTVDVPKHVEVSYIPVEHDPESAIGSDSMEKLLMCDTLMGIYQVAGLTYAMLAQRCDLHKIYYVPRALISNETFEALTAI